jgi:flagellar basal body P-ring formation protein FlgA
MKTVSRAPLHVLTHHASRVTHHVHHVAYALLLSKQVQPSDGKLTAMQHSRHTALRHAFSGHGAFTRRAYSQQLSFFVVRVVFATIVCALFYSVIASAQEAPRDWQSVQSIRDAAENYARDAARASGAAAEDLYVTAGDLDSRLQLAQCGNDLRAFTLNGAPLAARNTIAVRCVDESGPGWTVYIPTMIEIEKPIFVMRRSVPRDAHVALEDIELQRRRVAGLGAGYFSDMNALRDQHLKRGVPAGSPLTADSLTRDLVIKRGQEVALVLGSDSIAVRATGIALSDGGIADRIRVQNRSSLKVVEGVVESGNLVRVGM